MLRCTVIFIHSFIHPVICLTTGPKPPPKRCLHIVRSRASSFKLVYPLLSLRSSSSFFIHSVFCLTTDPKPPAKRYPHIVRSRASSFKWEYPLLSLRSSSSFLRLLHRILATSISPFIFPSITCFRRQFLRKMWPIHVGYSSAHWL